MPSLPESAAVVAAALAATAGAITYATVNSRSQWFGPMLVAPPLPHQIALTFDDGPNPAATPQLLEVLARHRVRATFFVIGRHVQREPALTREILAAGHIIGNHTLTHPWLPRYSDVRIQMELEGCSHLLEDTLGQPVTLFRPPHGARSPAVLRIARSLGLTTVGWNLILGDWKQPPAAQLAARIRQGLSRRIGTNIVLHDGGQHEPTAPRARTVEAVELLLASPPPGAQFVLPPDWR